ncbi:MAG TPA: PhoH family protein [Elusimicrobiota bacterium]|nr:PhoH family protein [Elusimicrobiota bacterium]
MSVKRLKIAGPQEALELLGEQDKNLKTVEKEFSVEIYLDQSAGAADLWLEIRGPAARVKKAFSEIRGKLLALREAGAIGAEGREHKAARHAPLPEDAVFRTTDGRIIRARTPNQRRYVDAIASHDLVFGIGPAGTGKTFLAAACALREMERGACRRVVITRPVVEAGEKLGFLPGDLLEKINPYLRPIYDSFLSMLGPERWRALRETEAVEIVPLAYMRGRTFDDAFIVLDEAQNATPEQMKMFLTRLGNGSRMVVTGDATQTDLGSKAASGLWRAREILSDVEGVAFLNLSDEDVMRHPLMRRILRAYEDWEKKR